MRGYSQELLVDGEPSLVKVAETPAHTWSLSGLLCFEFHVYSERLLMSVS